MMVPDDWRKLRVGDRIRIVAMPTGFSRNNCHRDTLKAYRVLIARRRSVRVCLLDELKFPWIRFQVRGPRGRLEYHGLAINHDGWVRVRKRKKRAKPTARG